MSDFIRPIFVASPAAPSLSKRQKRRVRGQNRATVRAHYLKSKILVKPDPLYRPDVRFEISGGAEPTFKPVYSFRSSVYSVK